MEVNINQTTLNFVKQIKMSGFKDKSLGEIFNLYARQKK